MSNTERGEAWLSREEEVLVQAAGRYGVFDGLDAMSAVVGSDVRRSHTIEVIRRAVEPTQVVWSPAKRPVRYCCGFAFDEARERVALVRKRSPDWQRGKLNGVGGKVEQGESAAGAMSREFHEETGHHVPAWAWREYARLSGNGYDVAFLWCVGPDELFVDGGRGEEDVEVVRLDEMSGLHVVPNLRWLVPLALDPSATTADCVDRS